LQEEDALLRDEISRRGSIIASQAGEIDILRQKIDALSRRIYGASSETGSPIQDSRPGGQWLALAEIEE